MTKIAINRCYGGFGLSEEALEHYNNLAGKSVDWDREIMRADTFLIQTIEELGDAANGNHAELRIVDIPDDVNWTVEEYDGKEWIAEVHRTWS